MMTVFYVNILLNVMYPFDLSFIQSSMSCDPDFLLNKQLVLFSVLKTIFAA